MKILGIPFPPWSKPAAEVATGGGVTHCTNNGRARVGDGVAEVAVPAKPGKPPEIFDMLEVVKVDIDTVMNLTGIELAPRRVTASEVQQRVSASQVWVQKMAKAMDDSIMATLQDDLLNTKAMPEWRPRDPSNPVPASLSHKGPYGTVKIRCPPKFTLP